MSYRRVNTLMLLAGAIAILSSALHYTAGFYRGAAAQLAKTPPASWNQPIDRDRELQPLTVEEFRELQRLIKAGDQKALDAFIKQLNKEI